MGRLGGFLRRSVLGVFCDSAGVVFCDSGRVFGYGKEGYLHQWGFSATVSGVYYIGTGPQRSGASRRLIFVGDCDKQSIAGRHCWAPLLDAIAGCHCWGAIAGCHHACHCWGAMAGVPWLDASYQLRRGSRWVPLLVAIADMIMRQLGLATGVLTSNRKGVGYQLWRGSRWVPLLGAIGRHCWLPLLECRHAGLLVGAIARVHCWMPLLGCYCWSATAGCHHACHCWVPLLGRHGWMLASAIARCHCWMPLREGHCWVPLREKNWPE